MDPSEEEQVAARRGVQREGIGIDAVVDRRQVVEARVAVRVADRHVGALRVVPLVDGENRGRREAVDGRQHGRVDEAAVGQRQEVEAVVDDVELGGPLEDVRDVQALAHLGLGIGIFRVPPGHDRRQAAGGQGVGRCEQGHVDAPFDEPLGEERGELLPRPVVPRRDPPRHRRQHGHPHLPTVPTVSSGPAPRSSGGFQVRWCSLRASTGCESSPPCPFVRYVGRCIWQQEP